MAKLTKEQIMVSEQMVQREVSIRQVARQLGVTEGALRYHIRKEAVFESYAEAEEDSEFEREMQEVTRGFDPTASDGLGN